MLTEKVNPAALRRLLDSDATERQLHRYIRRHPWVLYWTLCSAAGHSRYVFPSFPLGASYKTDFAVLNSYSYAFEIYFVELEPPTDRTFTKAGNPSRRLASAIKQVDDWRAFFEMNRVHVCQTLVNWAKRKDVLGYDSDSEPFNFSGQHLLDPKVHLFDYYVVVIGRSSAQSAEIRY